MTTTPSTSVSSDPVALLVVHGIGSQQKGKTLDGLLVGMRLVYGDRLDIRLESEDHAVLEGIGRPVHVFEVFWADLLQGEAVKGTFDFDRVLEAVWFPLLNHRNGCLSAEICTRGRVLRWTWVLAPVSSLLSAGFVGARFLTAFPTGVQRALRRSNTTRADRAKVGGIWKRVRAQHEDPDEKRTLLDDLMDQGAGDVFNYVHGVGRAFPVTSERNEQLTRNVDEIHARFLRAAERATEEFGCREIQVLAHSLGTVVAFVAMCPEADTVRSTTAPARISRFYTIGSPLEKIRFFWTRLVARSNNGPAIAVEGRLVAVEDKRNGESTMKWQNFFSRLDLVSGRLQKFPGWPTPINHAARGLGGLITSHVAYNSNADFLTLLAEGLTGESRQISISRVRRLIVGLRATLESLVLPATLLVLAMLGLAIMAGLGWVTGWLISQPLEWLDLGGWARGVRTYFVASILFVMTVVGVLAGRWRAKELYGRYWAPKQTK